MDEDRGVDETGVGGGETTRVGGAVGVDEAGDPEPPLECVLPWPTLEAWFDTTVRTEA